MKMRKNKNNMYNYKIKTTIYSEGKDKTNIFEYFIILIGVMATMLIITTAFNWNHIYEKLIIIESIIVTLVMCILFKQKKKVNIIIAIVIVIFIVGVINIHNIVYSFVKVFNNYKKYCVTEGVIVVGICSILLAFFITLIVKKKPSIILAIIVTLPFLLIVTLSGKLPSNVSFAMLIAFLLSILFMNVKKKKMNIDRETVEKSNAIIGITAIMIAFAIIMGICHVFTKEDYDSLCRDLLPVYNNIDCFMEDMSLENFKNIFKNNIVATGGVSGGELGNISKLEYDNSTDLIVNLPVEENLNRNIYLKGYVGGEYNSNCWKQVNDNDYKDLQKKLDNKDISGMVQNISSSEIAEVNGSLKGTSEKFINYKGKMQIENIDANKEYAYLPYASIYTDDFIYSKDLGCSAKDQDKYSVEYYNYEEDIDTIENIFSSKRDNDINKLEAIYRNYVHEVYTKLPSNSLKDIKQKYKGLSERNSLISCINIAKKAVLEGTKYDLQPGTLPWGKDFVEYFLNENRKGYCVHFASAGAVILRAMGVPARYVEGYVIYPEDFELASFYLSADPIEYNISDISILNTMSLEKLDEAFVEDIDERTINETYSTMYNINGEIYQLIIDQVVGIYDVDDQYKKTGDNTFRFMNVDYKIEDNKVKRVDEVDYDSIFSAGSSTAVQSQGAKVKLTDARAHAWVEVYIDGYGWYPVEFTPSNMNSDYDDYESMEEELNIESASNSGEENSVNQNEPSQSNTTESTNPKDIKVDANQDSSILTTILNILVIIVATIIAVFILTIVISRCIFSYKNKVMEKSSDRNKSAIYFYNKLIKSIEFYLGESIVIESYKEFAETINNEIKFIDIEWFNRLTELFLKAKYSNKQISKDELEDLIKGSYKIRQIIYNNLSRVKCFNYKYVKKCI